MILYCQTIQAFFKCSRNVCEKPQNILIYQKSNVHAYPNRPHGNRSKGPPCFICKCAKRKIKYLHGQLSNPPKVQAALLAFISVLFYFLCIKFDTKWNGKLRGRETRTVFPMSMIRRRPFIYIFFRAHKSHVWVSRVRIENKQLACMQSHTFAFWSVLEFLRGILYGCSCVGAKAHRIHRSKMVIFFDGVG